MRGRTSFVRTTFSLPLPSFFRILPEVYAICRESDTGLRDIWQAGPATLHLQGHRTSSFASCGAAWSVNIFFLAIAHPFPVLWSTSPLRIFLHALFIWNFELELSLPWVIVRLCEGSHTPRCMVSTLMSPPIVTLPSLGSVEK